MKIHNTHQYSQTLDENNISMIYNGPIWAGGIEGMAEMLIKRLEYEDLDETSSQSIFSVFVEQMNNILMYSAEKAKYINPEGNVKETSKGIFILGVENSSYFVQTGNVVKKASAAVLKERLEYLNSLDKKGLRQFYKQKVREVNDNPESQGAGVGLIEIARRSSGAIEFAFEPLDNELQYFTMYITIAQGGRE